MTTSKEHIIWEIQECRDFIGDIRDDTLRGNSTAFVKLTQLIGCLYGIQQDIRDSFDA